MSSGGGSKAPQGYQPTWQAGADQNYQGLIQNATPWATSLPGQVIPGLQTASNAITNNPYFSQTMTGAQNGANYGTSTASSLYGLSQNLGQIGQNAYNLGADTSGALTTLADRAGGIGQTGANIGQAGANLGLGGLSATQYAPTAGLKVAQEGQAAQRQTQAAIPGATQGLQALAGITAGSALGAIPGLTGGMGAADQVLNTGFDPQNALYNRTLQQTTDSQNAINSMYGLGSSAYGAGLAGDTVRNFNIDWQNNQLGRQTQALGAYGAEQGQVTNDLTSLLGSAATNYGNLTNSSVNNLTNLINTGMGAASTGANSYYSGLDTYLAGNAQALTGNAQGLAGNAQNLAGNAQNVTARQAAQTAFNTGGTTASNLWGASGDLGQAASALSAGAGGLPSAAYLDQQQASMTGLDALARGTTDALDPTRMVGGLDANYMGLGQSATQLAQNATKINNEQSNSQMGGLGKLVGTVASIALAPATGGMSLFGLGATSGASGGMALA